MDRLIKISMMLVIILSAFSCGNEKKSLGLITAGVDLENPLPITTDDGRVISLESNDSSLLYSVENLEKVGDSLIIRSRLMIKTFSSRDGKHLYNIGSVGDGPDQYLRINRIWTDDGLVCVYDNDVNALLKYNADGKFVSRERPYLKGMELGRDTKYVMMSPDSSYILGLNAYTDGTSLSNPLMSKYSLDGEFQGVIPGREVLDGSYLVNRLAADKNNNRLLYWEGLKDTIFAITADRFEPVYAIDFGALRFPGQENNALFEKARTFSSETKSGARYASNIQNIQVAGDLIFFVFTTGNENFYLAVLDENTDKIDVYNVASDRYRQTSFIRVIDDSLYMALTDMDNEEFNPALLVLPISKFSK